MASIKENLIAAKALIDTPEKWIKFDGRRGSCFCTIGAIGWVTDHGKGAEPGAYHAAYEAVVSALPDGELFVTRYNDDPATTHADIMALFDRAIAAQDGAA